MKVVVKDKTVKLETLSPGGFSSLSVHTIGLCVLMANVYA